MSEQNVSIEQVRIDPNEEITDQKKLVLLNQWKLKVETEVADYTAERDKIYQEYKQQKEGFDKRLNVRLKKIKKIDGLANNRKKVLADIIKEIEKLSEPPKDNIL